MSFASGMPERVTRAVRLEADLFEEVARDELASGTALAVALAAVALDALGERGGLGALLTGLASGALRFALAVALVAGAARLLDLGGGLGPIFRALGFAAAPLALGLLDALPVVGGPFWLAKWSFLLAAFSIALERVLSLGLAGAACLAAAALAVASLMAGAL
jgi:hypothetical protein